MNEYTAHEKFHTKICMFTVPRADCLQVQGHVCGFANMLCPGDNITFADART